MNTKSPKVRPPKTPWLIAVTTLLCVLTGCADSIANPEVDAPAPSGATETQLPPAKRVRFSKEGEVWIDAGRHEVIVGGAVCLRGGMLEMFACPEGTKEHESVVAVKSKAAVVHAALLAVGAKPGHPAQFDPVYRPAQGTVVDIDVTWADAEGKSHSTRAQNWVMHLPTNQPMSHDWVFGGSSFWKDEATGQEYYQAEGGELICLSNFSTATLDLPVNSSQDNADLLFGVFTKNVPELGTPVQLILRPRLKPPTTSKTERDKDSKPSNQSPSKPPG